MLDGGQNSDLVECVFLFFGAEVAHFDPFQRVYFVVLMPKHLVDGGIGPVAQFGQYLEVFDRHSTLVSSKISV